jgi:hypothetical protein
MKTKTDSVLRKERRRKAKAKARRMTKNRKKSNLQLLQSHTANMSLLAEAKRKAQLRMDTLIEVGKVIIGTGGRLIDLTGPCGKPKLKPRANGKRHTQRTRVKYRKGRRRKATARRAA